MGLRVLTLNVWALPEPLSTDVTGRMRRIGEQLPLLEADVVALQEVWTQGARRQLATAARRAGYEHIWHNQAAMRGGGLMLLSRLPLQRPQFRRFALGGLPQRVQHGDYYGGKGFVLVELSTSERALCLLNTHLLARYGQREGPDEYLGHRVAQVVEIAAALNERPGPVVALGDFNIREGQPEYRILLGLTGLRDAAAELDRRQQTRPSDHPSPGRQESSNQRIDFVLARDGIAGGAAPVRIRRVLDEGFGEIEQPRVYSDHCGLLAEIEIDDAPHPPHRPTAEALELARELLARGAELARQRRRGQRRLSGAAAGSALLLAASGRFASERRRLLRAALLTGAGAAIASSAIAVALAEILTPTELAGFEQVEAVLAELRAPPGAPRLQ